MKKLITLSAITLLLSSCVDFNKREKRLKELYPKNVVIPATGLLKRNGYEFLMEDTINKQIYGISFYTWSTTRIQDIVNIK